MRKLVTLLLLSAAAAAALALTTAGALANVPSPKNYTVDEAKQLSSTGFRHAQEGRAVEVTPAEALAAAQRPGSVTEVGVPDLENPDMPNVCWQHNGLWFEWGTWPYQQRVNESRYWCANCYGCAQTYRTSHVTLGGGGGSLCDRSGAYGFRTSGGNGYTWTIVRSGGHFACPTPIPWVVLHYDRWMEWACNTWGNCALYDHSCTNCLLPVGDGGKAVAARL
jgi:hypothetical protein